MQFIVIGGGGHARVVIDLLRKASHQVIGFTRATGASDGPNPPRAILGAPSLGDDESISAHPPSTVVLANGVGSVGNMGPRRDVFERFSARGYQFPFLVHPSAIVADDVILEPGCQIMAGAVVQIGTFVGVNSIVNTRTSVDHDCRIGAHVHLAPGVTVSGGVVIGDGAHLGPGVTVIQGIHIARAARVAAGAVVVNNVAPDVLVLGVPARPRR